ncbi:MAG TPA: hypothetical protein VNR62_02845 [Cellulomonas sp.]|nr:hypothetical protein [Cellulomonas sp.]
MTGAKRSTWIGGIAVLAVVLMAASWLLLISPALASASETQDQATAAEQQNDILELQVAKLQADFKKIDEYRDQLAKARAQLPSDADLATYVRELNAMAEKRDVTILSITPSSPQPLTLAAAPTPAPAATDGAATEPTDGASAAPSAADAAQAGATAAAATIVTIPVSLDVIGSFSDTQSFLHDLQYSKQRLFLVDGLNGTSQAKAAAGAGRPATAAGDQELVITGFTYVLPPAEGQVAEVPEKTAPKTNGSSDPLKPISGH